MKMAQRSLFIWLLGVLSVCARTHTAHALSAYDRMMAINPSTAQEACVYTGITASFAFMMSTFAVRRYGASADRWQKRFDAISPQPKKDAHSKTSETPGKDTPGAPSHVVDPELILSLCEKKKESMQRMYALTRYSTYVSAAVAAGSFTAAALLNRYLR